jgi:isopentenyl-diphosphate delta-isomerase
LLLLQRRALSKYHSGGLWTNTCCGHPRPEESVEAAARRRLLEEMGFELDLIRVFTFTYTARLANGLIENEIDHVFFGTFDQNPAPEPDEVADWQWLGEDQVRHQIGDDPERFTYWFKAALKNCKWPKVLETYVQERT